MRGHGLRPLERQARKQNKDDCGNRLLPNIEPFHIREKSRNMPRIGRQIRQFLAQDAAKVGGEVRKN